LLARLFALALVVGGFVFALSLAQRAPPAVVPSAPEPPSCEPPCDAPASSFAPEPKLAPAKVKVEKEPKKAKRGHDGKRRGHED